MSERPDLDEHAVEIDRYGGPEELVWRAVRRAPLGDDEVRIRTLFAAVNRADIEIRRGEWPIARDDPFPYTPGLEVVGVVDEVGAAVAPAAVAAGDHAITMMQRLGGIWGERPGGYGEFVVVRADAVATFAADVDAEQIAALGLAAVTAAEGLARLALAPGTRVVVHGASGGVGSAAVAFAAARGAEVVAVLPRAGKDDYVRELGAAQVVHLDEAQALGPRSVDAVLETTGARTFSDSVAILRRGGRLCLVGALTGPHLTLSAWDLIQELELTGWSSENLTGDELRRDIAAIVELVREHRLPAPAIERFALADAARAHRRIEAGELKGRALLVP
ncbi:MAG: zinc-binding alcohol dehydrogenase family protein [Thermoleophilia bacterium]